ncbi:methyltransferase domain-containing protein [Casimicrobium huifangae]|uniref:methyltransferase domain-containing protein n=1 Tax=Casimicrobium huifangae TaxID=2591109 RepID=UPI0012EBABB4|nr:methyltransferase domain-containing protein [Casimicrobium huifangae]HOB01282.1 methyltransferase domain-containing protein [Casimicrobium huifangae]
MSSSPYSLPALKTKADVEREKDQAKVKRFQAIDRDIQDGRLTEAAAALNELQKEDASDARIYVAGWLLALRAGNAKSALASARRAVDLAPMLAMPHYCLAESLRAEGDVAGARLSAEKALVLAPDNMKFRELAVNLANALGDYAAAEAHLRIAYERDPKVPGIKTMIASAMRFQQKLAEARQWFGDAIADNADDVYAHYGLAMVAHEQGDRDTAQRQIAEALRLQPDDPEFLYLRAAFSGETPERQPEAMTRGVFDQYAPRFDKHLVGALKYRVPQRIAKLITDRYPDRKLSILDLGCGTGLVGASVGRIDGHFVGVDLSLPMIEEAKKHGAYTRFHHVNLLDALDATDANEFDVVVAGDVFIYVGAVETPLRDAFKVLKRGGWIFFSCERAAEDGPDLVLEKSLRYSHKASHVRTLLDQLGFVACEFEDVDLRTENGVAIPGFIVSAQKPL